MRYFHYGHKVLDRCSHDSSVEISHSHFAKVSQESPQIKQLFFQACQVNKWWIDELNVQSDHVHMLIQTKPRESVSEVVQLLKGGSSKVIRLEFPDLEEYLWGDSFWSDGYFAETVGVVNESIIKDYIKNQHDESI